MNFGIHLMSEVYMECTMASSRNNACNNYVSACHGPKHASGTIPCLLTQGHEPIFIFLALKYLE